jgi:prolyl-tRNA editing enzyme YbaK/EbsC (Cys-tRNA(Pro) deacylase)
MDKELFRFKSIRAATGHPHAVFEVTPQALQSLTQAPVVDVAVAE